MSNANSAGAPIQPSSKGPAAAPKLNSDMEMGNLPTGDAPPSEPDIMQFARVGDIPAMEKLLNESSDYDATYTDDEGITPLHVMRQSVTLLEVLC